MNPILSPKNPVKQVQIKADVDVVKKSEALPQPEPLVRHESEHSILKKDQKISASFPHTKLKLKERSEPTSGSNTHPLIIQRMDIEKKQTSETKGARGKKASVG